MNGCPAGGVCVCVCYVREKRIFLVMSVSLL